MITFTLCLLALIAGYFTYGRLMERVFAIWILKQFLLPRLMFRVPTLRISLHNLLFSTVG